MEVVVKHLADVAAWNVFDLAETISGARHHVSRLSCRGVSHDGFKPARSVRQGDCRLVALVQEEGIGVVRVA